MPLRVDARAWAKVLSRFGTPQSPRSFDELLWLGPEPHWHRVQLWVPPDWTYLVICTKDSSVRWWSEQGPSPADIAVVHAGFPNDPRVTAVLRPLHRRATAAALVGACIVAWISFLATAGSFVWGRHRCRSCGHRWR